MKTKTLERTSLQCDTTLQCNILASARKMCQDSHFLFLSWAARDGDGVLTQQKM